MSEAGLTTRRRKRRRRAAIRVGALSLLLIFAWLRAPSAAAGPHWMRELDLQDLESSPLRQTADGALFASSCHQDPSLGGEVTTVLRLDAFGELRWATTVGDGAYHCGRVLEATDGGLLIAGTSEVDALGGPADAWLYKLTPGGQPSWEKALGAPSVHESIAGAASCPDGGFLLTGISGSVAGGGRTWILKLDADGGVQWSKMHAGDRNLLEDVIPFADGTALVVGWAGSSLGLRGDDGWAALLDAAGEPIWSSSYGGPEVESFATAIRATNGDFVLLGRREPPGGGAPDLWAVRLDTAGEVLWDRRIGGPGADWGIDLHELDDGRLRLLGRWDDAGSRRSWLLVLGADGLLLDQVHFGSVDEGIVQFLDRATDGDLLLGGWALRPRPDRWDGVLMRLPADPAAWPSCVSRLVEAGAEATAVSGRADFGTFTPESWLVTDRSPGSREPSVSLTNICPCAEPSAVDLSPSAPPLRVERLSADLRICWEPTEGARLYEGRLDSLWSSGSYSHADIGLCDVDAPCADIPVTASNTYYIASASCWSGEGPRGRDSSGRDRPGAMPACP